MAEAIKWNASTAVALHASSVTSHGMRVGAATVSNEHASDYSHAHTMCVAVLSAAWESRRTKDVHTCTASAAKMISAGVVWRNSVMDIRDGLCFVLSSSSHIARTWSSQYCGSCSFQQSYWFAPCSYCYSSRYIWYRASQQIAIIIFLVSWSGFYASWFSCQYALLLGWQSLQSCLL